MKFYETIEFLKSVESNSLNTKNKFENMLNTILIIVVLNLLVCLFMNLLGQYYDCKKDGCTLTPPCFRKCQSMGYPKGGECRIYSYGGECCCERSFESQYSPISSLPY